MNAKITYYTVTNSANKMSKDKWQLCFHTKPLKSSDSLLGRKGASWLNQPTCPHHLAPWHVTNNYYDIQYVKQRQRRFPSNH